MRASARLLIESDLETFTMRPDLGCCTKGEEKLGIFMYSRYSRSLNVVERQVGRRAICNQQCWQLKLYQEILY